jgi:hypothetical protein
MLGGILKKEEDGQTEQTVVVAMVMAVVTVVAGMSEVAVLEVVGGRSEVFTLDHPLCCVGRGPGCFSLVAFKHTICH